ncbi:MAG TPA: hypothetical protein VMZ28_14480 [Kofleriaceae bacterium]|nr:hypothetical protein [Kofleriaceae bacterium]
MLRCRDLSGTCTREAGELQVTLSGTADGRWTVPMAEFVAAVEQEAESGPTPVVVVDFRELEFMSSSCFKAFVTWLQHLLDMPDDRRYRIRFVSNPKRHWQARSLRALACFATELVDVV